MSAALTPAKLRTLREIALTAAAFCLVIAVVLGLGPFGGTRTMHHEAADHRLSAEAVQSSRLAALP